MDIQKQIEFEKFHARECNCDYDELKRRLDHQEKVIGHRYIPSSPRHEAWLVWDAAWQAKAQAVPEGFVLVPTKSVKYFSNDGENYEIHDTLAEAKREAECAIEHFSERLADQLSDPRSDGNFQDVGYGVVLAQSAYSIDHIVTQDDIDNGDYSYEVGTEIMSLFLAEAQEQSHG